MVKLLALLLFITYIQQSFSVEIVSDSLYIDELGMITAEGEVTAVFKTIKVTAERVKYDPKSGNIFAYGGVKVIDQVGDLDVIGKEAFINIKTNKGYFIDAKGRFREFYFSASRVDRIGQDEFIVTGGDITTCQPHDKEMKMCFQKAFVNKKYVFSFGNTLRFFGVPVAYSPLLAFPVGERRTGLLPPMLGGNSYNAFIYIQPVFWAISDDKDATLTFDIRSSQAKGISFEYRQALTEKDRIFANISYYLEPEPPGDWWKGRQVKTFKNNRYRLDFSFTKGDFQIGIDTVSDPYFFEDIYFSQKERTTPYTVSYLTYSRLTDSYLLYLNLRRYFDLTFPNNKRAFSLLPELNFYLKSRKLLFGYLSLASSYTNFDRRLGLSFGRFILIPTFQVPLKIGPVTLYSSTKLITNIYSIKGFREQIYPDSSVYSFKFETRLPLFTTINVSKFNIHNSVEVVHTFSPKNFNNPQIDSYDQVIRENNLRFRLNTSIAYGRRNVMNLFMESGLNLLSSYRFPTDNKLIEEKMIPIRAILSFFPNKWFSLNEDITYDPNLKIAASSVTYLTVKRNNTELSFGYVLSSNSERRKTLDQFYIKGESNIKNIILGFSATVDNLQKKSLYRNIFLGYKGGCWMAKLDVRSTYYGEEKGYINELYLTFNIFNLQDITLPLRRR